ncbi:MAG: VOC family protein [Acidobacteria bacterium]|nr:VOC family protein [Acidobacteriota bacterium]
MTAFKRPNRGPIRGIHHITGLVGSAANDLGFYRDVLGLRLVKKTCNQENPTSGWHFFFGDRLGHPGTIMTNIVLEGIPMSPAVDGRGSITDVSYSVSPGSLDFWRERLTAAGCTCTDRPARFGDPVLHFRDFDGISSELVGCEDTRVPELADLPEEHQIRGFHHATIAPRLPELTLQFLVGVLGFEVVATEGSRTRLAVGGNEPGKLIDVVERDDGPWGRHGLGGLHHIALTVDSVEDMERWTRILAGAGLIVTGARDRGWFHSTYFTAPGGINLELSNLDPGWTVDEDIDSLGTILSLPKHLEPQREAIEAALPRVEF